MPLIDLHAHTNYSDGEHEPEQLVAEALELGLNAIAVTDHDTVAGVERTLTAGGGDIEIVPGIEFTTVHNNVEVHILGFYLPLDNPMLSEYLTGVARQREERGRRIIEKLNAIGYEITYEEASKVANFAPIMSPHILRAMHARGMLRSVDDAWRFYKEHLADGADCYVPHSVDIREPLRIMKETGCPSVIAHPHKLKDDKLVAEILELGCDGFEAYYPDMDEPAHQNYINWAKKEGLLATGGSDYHGVFTARKLGSANVPDDVLTDVKRLRDRMRE